MTERTLLELFEDAFRIASEDAALTPSERWEAQAKSEFFAPFAMRLRLNEIEQLVHSETAACMILGFLLMGVDEDNLPARLEKLAERIVDERSLLIDMQTFAEGESHDDENTTDD